MNFKTCCPEELINDPRISMKELGLWLYIASNPKGCNLTIEDICKHTADGKASIKSALKSLEELGLLSRRQVNKNGRFGAMEYILKSEIWKRKETGKVSGYLKNYG